MKIQNKRSGSAGKEPTAGQTEYGELCINFHESDPALYIKDTNDVIRRVGADVENYYTKEEIEGLDWDTSVADARYLRIDVDAPDQTRVAGEATFAELTTHEGGVKVTGGTRETLAITGNGTSSIRLNDVNNAVHNDSEDSSVAHAFSTTRLGTTNLSSNVRSLLNLNSVTRDRVVGVLAQTNSDARSTALDLFSTAIGAGVVQTRANSTLVGYKSTINNADINSTGAVAYNFYASGDAPNYFKGLTEHVGGVKLPALLSAPVLATDADGNIIASDALTESEGDGLYLSKVNDDTAAGKITFNERPTFEKGIEVIEGGSGTKNGVWSIFGNYLRATSENTTGSLVQIAVHYNANAGFTVNKNTPANFTTISSQYGCVVNFDANSITISGGNTNLSGTPTGFSSRLQFNDDTVLSSFAHYGVTRNRNEDGLGGGKAPTVLSYFAANNSSIGLNDGTENTAFNDTSVSAFYSSFSTGTANAKEIFVLNSTGTAPSFHNGNVFIGGNTTDLGNSTKINLNASGLGEFKGGVKVENSDGSKSTSLEYASGIFRIQDNDNGGRIQLHTNRVNISPPLVDSMVGVQASQNLPDGSTSTALECFKSNVTGTGQVTELTGFSAIKSSGVTAGTIKGFFAGGSLAGGTTGSYGFYSNVTEGTNNYAFYAANSAANFFNGSTYIGGSVSRTTFELWKSTLTEEQLEQLEAGTLVAPANVATPGDGEFARQWWYDQQDEETQAAIDAGELEYPEHLAAATFTDTFELGDHTKINLNSDGSARFRGTVNANAFEQKYKQDFTQVINSNNVANLGLKLFSSVGSGIGIRSVNSPGNATNLSTNCASFIFNRATNSTGSPEFDENDKLVKTDLVPCNTNAVLGELNWSTSNGETDIYLARFTAYNRAKGGELELSLHNTETDLDYQYYFDSQGFLGLRFDGKDEFFINVDQNNNQTKFKTTKDRFNFESATGTYSFNTPDFNSNLNIKADTDFIGVTTSISNDAGLYGIRHTSNRTVSLVNSNGELRLGTNGDGVFIKGADTVTITPGGTSAGSSAGTINATASNSNKVKLNTFGNSNNRPIACFGAELILKTH